MSFGSAFFAISFSLSDHAAHKSDILKRFRGSENGEGSAELFLFCTFLYGLLSFC